MAAIPTHPAGSAQKPLNVLMVGTGEYTTGFVGDGASKSDKKIGVVGLTMFDLRRRGKVGELSMAGVSGDIYPQIREFPPLPNDFQARRELILLQERISKRTSVTPTTILIPPSRDTLKLLASMRRHIRRQSMHFRLVMPLQFSPQTLCTFPLLYTPSNTRSTSWSPSQQ